MLLQYDIVGIEDAHCVFLLFGPRFFLNPVLFLIVFGHDKMGWNACKPWQDGVHNRFEWRFPPSSYLLSVCFRFFTIHFFQPFWNIAEVQAIADRIKTLTAVCEYCNCGTCEAPFSVKRRPNNVLEEEEETWKPATGSSIKDEGIYPSCSSNSNEYNLMFTRKEMSSKNCMPICRGCLTAYNNCL